MANTPKIIQNALDFIGKTWQPKQKRDNRNNAIVRLFEEGFMLNPAITPRYLTNKLLYQAVWRMVQRTKILDFEIHGTDKKEWEEKMMTAGFNTIFERGNGTTAFRNKNGMFFKMWLFGDAFLHLGTTDKKEVPIEYGVLSNSNVYVDYNAVSMRNCGTGQSVTQMAVIMSYSQDEAYAKFPELKRNKVKGFISRGGQNYRREVERDPMQTAYTADNVEVCYWYDINRDEYAVFAGDTNYVLTMKKGDEYPYICDGESFIPVIHHHAFPASQGFFNYGLGDYLYDVSLVNQRLKNMAIHHATQNVDPYTVINLPKGTASEFMNRLRWADQQHNIGRRAWIPIEYDTTGATSPVTTQSLVTQNAIAELQLILQLNDEEVARGGINLNEIVREANVTATQILSEEESQQALVKQTMEYNASETQNMVRFSLDLIKEKVRSNNDTPLNTTTRIINDEGVELPASKVTYGLIASELKDSNWFVKVNARTGAIPSGIARQTKLQRAMTVAQGTPAFLPLAQQFLAENDADVSIQSLQQANPDLSALDTEAIPNETARMSIDARKPQTQI